MSFSNETNRISYTGDGSTTAFSVTFPFFDHDELIVLVVVTATGVETTQVKDTDYTVTGGAGSTGTVTMTTAPASTDTLVIVRDPDRTQEVTSLLEGGKLDEESLEAMIDRVAMQAARAYDLASRALRVKDGYTGPGDLELPDLPFVADKLLAVNAAGTGLELISKEVISDNITVTAFAETLLDDSSAAAMRTTLGLNTLAEIIATVNAYTKQQHFTEATLTDGANISWNLDDEQVAKVTLAGNRTLDDPTNMKAGGVYVLTVIQDATGSRTLAYGSAYEWPGGTAPTLSTGANAVDILTFVCNGTVMRGVGNLNFS